MGKPYNSLSCPRQEGKNVFSSFCKFLYVKKKSKERLKEQRVREIEGGEEAFSTICAYKNGKKGNVQAREITPSRRLRYNDFAATSTRFPCRTIQPYLVAIEPTAICLTS